MGVVLLPESLRAKLGDEGAKDLALLINDVSETVKKHVLDTTVDRFEKRLIEVKGDLEKQIVNAKADLIKWMFIFWMGQITVVLGLVAYLK